MRIAVAGGTGVVGAHVVEVAREAGHEVVALSRSAGTDLMTGVGLAEALSGVETVVDVASVATIADAVSREFFGTVTRNLHAAEVEAGVRHHVALSIVGIDEAPHGYYAGKVLQEQLVTDGPVPWSILRATQFHEFAAQMYERGRRGPVVLVPAMRSETVAAREVAERLVQLAETGPSGRVPDLGGPDVAAMSALVRSWLRATGRRNLVVTLPLPGAFGKAMRDGTLVTGAGADHGTTTFAQWLSGQGASRG